MPRTEAVQRMQTVIYKLKDRGIEDEPARKAAPILEYLYRRSVGYEKIPGEKEMPSHCQRIGQIWAGMQQRGIPFYFPNEDRFLVTETPIIAVARQLDNISIGVEVGVHLGLINLSDGVKSGLSAKGLEFIES